MRPGNEGLVMIEELVKQSPPWVGGLQGAGRAVEQ